MELVTLYVDDVYDNEKLYKDAIVVRSINSKMYMKLKTSKDLIYLNYRSFDCEYIVEENSKLLYIHLGSDMRIIKYFTYSMYIWICAANNYDNIELPKYLLYTNLIIFENFKFPDYIVYMDSIDQVSRDLPKNLLYLGSCYDIEREIVKISQYLTYCEVYVNINNNSNYLRYFSINDYKY